MNVPLLIARRYFRSKNKRNIITIISNISMIGVAVGTAALIIVLSVFNGLEDLVRTLYGKSDPNLVISATKGTNVKKLYSLIKSAQEAMNRRVSTGELNRFVDRITHETNMKVKYITQAGVRPPSFVVFTDKSKPLHFSEERFLINQIRKEFKFGATPIEIKAKTTPGRGRRDVKP